MHRIIARAQLSPNVTRLVVEAPRLAEIRRPGQFVIVRLGPGAERIRAPVKSVDETCHSGRCRRAERRRLEHRVQPRGVKAPADERRVARARQVLGLVDEATFDEAMDLRKMARGSAG